MLTYSYNIIAKVNDIHSDWLPTQAGFTMEQYSSLSPAPPQTCFGASIEWALMGMCPL